MSILAKLLLLSWAFIVMNDANEPYWKISGMSTSQDCEIQRKWMESQNKKVGPCYEEFRSQLQK